MPSTCTDAGTYTLTVTFAIGTDLDFALVLVQNKVSAGTGVSCRRRVQAGRHRPEEVAGILLIVSTQLAERHIRQPVPEQLRDHQPLINELSRLPGVGNCVGARARRVLDARLARPAETLHLRTDAVGGGKVIQEQSQPVTAGKVGAPPRPRARTSSTRSTSWAGSARPRSSATSSSSPSRAMAGACCG